MTLPFYKLQGAGNDFIMIDNREICIPIKTLLGIIPKLCDRRFGIGADGFIALSDSEISNYKMQYFNADGSDAGMCGNGGRCAARLASHLGFKASHTFEVHGNIYSVDVEPTSILLHFPATPSIESFNDVEYGQIDIINTGTEHICIQVKKELIDDNVFLRSHGEKLRYDVRFSPNGTNVNFYIPLDDHTIKLVTYERGVENLTLACGTGSLAAAICSVNNSGATLANNKITVQCPGGNLICHFNRPSTTNLFNNLKLEGPAEIVYTGEIQI
jgi:diaminopimelate epimerase